MGPAPRTFELQCLHHLGNASTRDQSRLSFRGGGNEASDLNNPERFLAGRT